MAKTRAEQVRRRAGQAWSDLRKLWHGPAAEVAQSGLTVEEALTRAERVLNQSAHQAARSGADKVAIRRFNKTVGQFAEALTGQPVGKMGMSSGQWQDVRKVLLQAAKSNVSRREMAILAATSVEQATGKVGETAARSLIEKRAPKAPSRASQVAKAIRGKPSTLAKAGWLAGGLVAFQALEGVAQPFREKSRLRELFANEDFTTVELPHPNVGVRQAAVESHLRRHDPEMAQLMKAAELRGNRVNPTTLPRGAYAFPVSRGTGDQAGLLDPRVAELLGG